MRVTTLALVLLSLCLLAAHFLRGGQLLAMTACLALIGLLAVRRPWARRALQVALGFGAWVWVRTLVTGVGARRAAGGDWRRLAAILGGVTLVAVVAAVLLETRPMRERFCSRDLSRPAQL